MTESVRTFVRGRVTVPGLHCWPEAPETFRPLRSPHRHLFTFELECETDHGDRAVEFIDLSRRLAAEIDGFFMRTYWDGYDFGNGSCEMLAAWALERFPGARRCTVWEDGENAGGAERAS